MMIGHNTDNLVTGCWIEHMGVNGVTLSNRFAGPDKSSRTEDRCERNRVMNCRIHDVGEIHCYASCVNAFNVSDNEGGALRPVQFRPICHHDSRQHGGPVRADGLDESAVL